MSNKILNRKVRDIVFYSFVNGYLEADPEASKFKAINVYKKEYNDFRDVRNLYKVYDDIVSDMDEFNKNQ